MVIPGLFIADGIATGLRNSGIFMAFYLFINGDAGVGNLSTLANWRNSNSSGGNVSAAGQLPVVTDDCFYNAAIKTGSMTANTLSLTGGTSKTMGGGTVNANVTTYGQINAITINGSLNFNGSLGVGITTGTFNGTTSVANASALGVSGGIFQILIVNAADGSFIDGPVTVSQKLSLDNGSTFLWSSSQFTDPGVANVTDGVSYIYGGVTQRGIGLSEGPGAGGAMLPIG